MKTSHVRQSRNSSIGTVILAGLAAFMPACGSTPKTDARPTTAYNSYDGLISREKPSFAAVGGSVSNLHDEANVRAKVIGYPFSRVLAEANVSGVPHSDRFRGDDGSYNQQSIDGNVTVYWDLSERKREERMKFDNVVYALGLTAGGSLNGANDAFVKDQQLTYFGPQALVLHGPFQMRAGYRWVPNGKLGAQNGFDGDMKGHLGFGIASYDAGSVLNGSRLVLLVGGQYSALDRNLRRGEITGTETKLASDTREASGQAGALLDFGKWYLGPRVRLGHVRMDNGSNNPAANAKDSQGLIIGADALGGFDLSRATGISWLPVLDLGAGYTHNDALDREVEYGGTFQIRWNFP